MKKLAAFVYMDLYTLKPYLKSALLTVGMGILLGFCMKSPMLATMMVVVSLILYSSYPFAVAEKNGLDTLYSLLPLKRAGVVAGRYLFALVALALAMLVSLILTLSINAAFRLETTPLDAVMSSLSLAGMLMILIAVQYPVYFRFGYAKAKLAATLPVLVLSVGIAVLGSVLPGSLDRFVEVLASLRFSLLLPVFGLALNVLSALLSLKLYEGRDL